jgi:hypothetical protein
LAFLEGGYAETVVVPKDSAPTKQEPHSLVGFYRFDFNLARVFPRLLVSARPVRQYLGAARKLFFSCPLAPTVFWRKQLEVR